MGGLFRRRAAALRRRGLYKAAGRHTQAVLQAVATLILPPLSVAHTCILCTAAKVATGTARPMQHSFDGFLHRQKRSAPFQPKGAP